jgi:hypothetical protein
MTELAVRDGCLYPEGLPHGECIVTSLADGSIRVDRADPRVLISGELLDDIMRHPAEHAWCESTADDGGVLLKIEGVNRTVVYRVTEYVAPIHGYIAEWPD